MNQSNFIKNAGIGGIISALLFIISIVGMQYFIEGDIKDMTEFTRNMNDAHVMMLIYGWPGMIATLFIMPLTYVFHKFNKSSAETSKVIFLVTVIGLTFILIGYLFQLALTYFHAPIYHEIDVSQQEAFGILIRSTIGLQDMFWLGGDLLSFLGIAFILLLGFKENIYPKWFLMMGAMAGTLAALGSFGFIPYFKQYHFLGLAFIGGFSVFAIWEIIAGYLMIRQSIKSTSTVNYDLST